jgi:pilus assembly protein CpaB
MNMGTILTTENLTMADWPKANTPKGSFTDIKKVEGRVSVTRITAGMPIVSAELAAPGSGAGLVALIEPGKRAMAIQVNEVIGVGGFILPNTFVDVISIQGSVAKTVLKKIEVLAVAQETFVEEGQTRLVRTVTLELDQKQTLKLAETTHKGPIQLALRNPAEDEEEPPKPEPKKGTGKKVARKYVPKKQYDTFKVELVQGDRRPENYTFKYEKQ